MEENELIEKRYTSNGKAVLRLLDALNDAEIR